MAKKHVKEMLKKYASSNPVRLHMPGHKGKTNLYDVTEISTTDNLNSPEKYIGDAQQALNKSYGCAHSFFMVNGSTGAIYAMIKYAQLKSQYPILISRNSHKSIFSACTMFNVDAIIIDDKFDNQLQTFIFDEAKVLESIEKNKLSAIVITPVDYYGRVIDVAKISKLCKEKNVLLLCDEAHGAHYRISDMLPDSAVQYADLCAQSPHKTLSALTQCAYLHASDTVDIDRLKNIIYSLQTSSPSFLLVQSMDDARYDADIMQTEWEKRIESVGILSARINKIDGISIVGSEWAKRAGYSDKDITRLVIDVEQIGSGIEICSILENKYNIFMEMCSFKYLVGILTPWDDDEWDERLCSALNEISKNERKTYQIPCYPQMCKQAISMPDALKAGWKSIRLEDAGGEIAGVSVGVYPPGVALVLPGEVISRDIIEYILGIEKLGGATFGLSEECINCINIKGQ